MKEVDGTLVSLDLDVNQPLGTIDNLTSQKDPRRYEIWQPRDAALIDMVLKCY